MGRKALIGITLVAVFAPAGTPASAATRGQYVDVAVATLWTAPGIGRGLDSPSLARPARIRAWLNAMGVTSRRWLEGRLETQALFGQRVSVLARRGRWVKIAVAGQPTPRNRLGYPGWLPQAQLSGGGSFAGLTGGRFALVRSPTAWLYDPDPATGSGGRRFAELSFGTRLPVLAQSTAWITVATPAEGPKVIARADAEVHRDAGDFPAASGRVIVRTARRFVGLAYLWAGTSGFGFDCSGFTHAIFDAAGVTIPRDADDQARAGVPVSRAQLRPGDLVFFAGSGGRGAVHHVGVYAGSGRIIDAPHTGARVAVRSLHSAPYAAEYAGARRYARLS